MPRTYKRKTTKGNWVPETLVEAVTSIRTNMMSIRKAAKTYNIPFSTLQDRLKTNNFKPAALGRPSIFTSQQESEMAKHIINLANLFYGLTPLQLRTVAFEFAENNKIKHNFNQQLNLAGVDWFYNFVRRNPTVTVRKPEAISISRITAFNKTEVQLFFQNLGELMLKYKFCPTRVYNMDETGITTVHDPGKIIGSKGQKRIGSVTSWERGKNNTVICAMSASGSFIPPLFIFPRKRMDMKLTKHGPPGAVYECTKNGWTTEDIFMKWLKHFKNYSNPTKENPMPRTYKRKTTKGNWVPETLVEAVTSIRTNMMSIRISCQNL
eukprot:XP_016662600.1 PREDICTED: uncharacterized protein LOC107884617 [Acyrthosiphon pisum]